MDRREELEKKKQKLAELKRQREMKMKDSSQQPTFPVAVVVEKENETQQLKVIKKGTLTLTKQSLVDLPPSDKIVYNKGIQTVQEESEEEEKVALTIPTITKIPVPVIPMATAAEPTKKERPELSEEDRKKLLQSDDFVSFFSFSSKVMERALNEEYDVTINYALDSHVEKKPKEKIKCFGSFAHDKLTPHRTVTDVQWSNRHQELLVASYNKNAMNANEPHGRALVWNLHMMERPEFEFQTQSEVLSISFSDFHPNIVIGGTYSGQIVLWDTRSSSSPVLQTPSTVGHTHPVYSLKVVGTKNAHNLISTSTDGTLCAWQLDMLAKPLEVLELLNTNNTKNQEVASTCMDFPLNETSSCWVGSEEGRIYHVNRYERAGTKAGINANDAYVGHEGVVTGIHFHQASGAIDFSDVFLTSSMDWTVKLWRTKNVSKPSSSFETIQPLYSFEEFTDYVYDVKWSPKHPAVFAAIDGFGTFHLWNLNAESELPILKTNLECKTLNKLAWDRESQRIAIATGEGSIIMYDVGNMLPGNDDWTQFNNTLLRMK